MTVVESRPLRAGVFDQDEGVLLASSCVDCAAVRFPPKRSCPICGSDRLETVALPPTGTIRRYTIVRNAPTMFPQPYVLAYVQLDGTSTQAFGQVRDLDVSSARTGLAVRLCFGPLRTDPDGTEVVGYWFVPQEEQK